MTPSGGFSDPAPLAAFVVAISLVGFLVLAYESSWPIGWRRWVRRAARGLTGRDDFAWIDARLVTGLAAVAFGVGALVTWGAGGYRCTAAGPSDLLTLVASGQAFLHGGDPFTITACGHSGNPVPAGLASVLLDAFGSLGGPAGVLAVWGTVSVAVIPLVWSLAGGQASRVAVFVLASFLYLPIVAVQVDGASLALVPAAVLLALWWGRRGWARASAVGGFLATGRFPALFPIVGASGRAGRRRVVASAAALGVFVAVTAATFVAYGSRFTGPVFLLQFSRSNFALNYWGVLQGAGWLEPSTAVTVVQAVLTVTLVGVCWAWARSELGAAAIVLTGTVLLAQFLSFTELVFLVPVALIGSRARWWLWAIGVVGSTDYLLAMRSLASLGRPLLISYALDLLLTALLLGLMTELLREQLSVRAAARAIPSSVPAGPT
jgi:hypothetical protein